MFKKMTALLSLILALAFTTSVAAQDAPMIEEELEGLESAYARMFMPDFEAMFETIGTPGAETSFDEDAVMVVMTVVYTFDSEESASNSLGMIEEGFSEEGADSGMEQSELDGMGDTAVMYSGNVEEAGTTSASVIVVVQDGEQVYMSTVIGGELETSEQQAQDIAQFMTDAEVTTDEVTFNPDGTSTGGAFDRMPTADDTDLIGDLVPSDMDLANMDASGL